MQTETQVAPCHIARSHDIMATKGGVNMANYPADRHKNSTTFTVRVDLDLLADFDAKRSMESKSRRELIIKFMEEYAYGKQRSE